jgi:hypothetical protein
MKKNMGMTYIEILKKRLDRKVQQLKEVESTMQIGDQATAIEKRKFIELKAVIQELENVIDLAESMLDQEQ